MNNQILCQQPFQQMFQQLFQQLFQLVQLPPNYVRIAQFEKELAKLKTKNISINSVIDAQKWTLLMRACALGFDEYVASCLKFGASINDYGQKGWKPGSTPLNMACTFGKYTTAKLLIEHGAHLQSQLHNNLRCAITGGNLELVQFLYGCKKESFDFTSQFNDIVWACHCGHLHILTYLLQLCPNYKWNSSELAFAVTNETEHLQLVQFIVNAYQKHNIPLDVIEPLDGSNALCRAVEFCHKTIVSFLLQNGCDPTIRDTDSGMNALEKAKSCNFIMI